MTWPSEFHSVWFLLQVFYPITVPLYSRSIFTFLWNPTWLSNQEFLLQKHQFIQIIAIIYFLNKYSGPFNVGSNNIHEKENKHQGLEVVDKHNKTKQSVYCELWRRSYWCHVAAKSNMCLDWVFVTAITTQFSSLLSKWNCMAYGSCGNVNY